MAGHVDRRRVLVGHLVSAFLRAGWTPPPPGPRVLDRLTEDLRRLPAHASLRLSPMERHVLFLVAEGNSTRGVADELGVGYETVKERLSGVRRKLGARNTANALAIALRTGEID